VDGHNVVSQLERSTSVLKEHYPGYEGTYNLVPVAGVTSRGLQQPVPMSFAWPHYNSSGALVSPPYDDDDDDVMLQSPKRSISRSKLQSQRRDSRSSEYTAKFIAPTGAASPRASQHPSTLNIFDRGSSSTSKGNGYGEESKGGDMSEYESKYIRYSGGSYGIERPSKDLQKRNYPVQFAWTLEDKDKDKDMLDDDAAPPVRMKRVPNPDQQDISEHQREFNWPPPPPRDFALDTASSTLQHRRNGPVVVLDEADMDTSKWQSEYDERCAQLRMRQRDLLLNNHEGGQGSMGGKAAPPHIAGLPSAQHDKYPVNFVWESLPPPPPSVVVNTDRDREEEDHRTSEYGDKFINWPIPSDPSSTITRREPLNIFAIDKNKNNNNRGEKDDDDYEMISNPVLSEYKEQYQAISSLDQLHTQSSSSSLASQNHMKAQLLSNEMPSQFAWDRTMPIPKKTQKPISNFRFNEISEYDSVFSWPPSSSAAKLSRPSSSLVSSGALIRPIDNKEVVSHSTNHWISEYDDNTTKIRMIDNEASSSAASATATVSTKEQQRGPVTPAGIITVQHDSLPHFYAWFDEETAKPSAASVKQKKVIMTETGDTRASEYDDRYLKWSGVSDAKRVVPRWSCVDYNLITNHQKGGGDSNSSLPQPSSSSGNVEQKSEYDDLFPSYSSDVIKEQYNPYVSKEAIAAELASKAPPQFAWPLVDPIEDKKKAMRAASNKLNESTDNKYRPGHGPVSVYHVTSNDRRALLDSPLALKPYNDLIQPSQWQSEYDDRNNLFLESINKAGSSSSTSSSTAAAVVKPVAGIQTQRSPEIQPFGVWEPEVGSDGDHHPHPQHRVLWGINKRPEQTEYSASFTERALQTEVSNDHHHYHHIMIIMACLTPFLF